MNQEESTMTTSTATRSGFTLLNAPIISSLAASLARWTRSIQARHRMVRDMATLRSFDPHMLADIGLKGFHHLPEDAQEAMLRAALRNNRFPV
jgi:uncharacterized protein YjiS (DUF1127 family)